MDVVYESKGYCVSPMFIVVCYHISPWSALRKRSTCTTGYNAQQHWRFYVLVGQSSIPDSEATAALCFTTWRLWFSPGLAVASPQIWGLPSDVPLRLLSQAFSHHCHSFHLLLLQHAQDYKSLASLPHFKGIWVLSLRLDQKVYEDHHSLSHPKGKWKMLQG